MKVYKGFRGYIKVHEGIWRYISIHEPTFSTLFFLWLFWGPLFRHRYFLFYFLVLFGLIWSYVVLFCLIWYYLVSFSLIWSYLVLSGLIWLYFDFIWSYLLLFDFIQVPIKPKKGPGRRHLTFHWEINSNNQKPSRKADKPEKQ